jgi:hypothetical protein
MIDWIKFQKEGNDYFFDFVKFSKVEISPLDAALLTVQKIQDNYPPPYTLMLSGGVDSQAMLYAWHISGVPYKTLSAQYNERMNENDLVTLRQFSSSHGIQINYVDFDLLTFLDKEHKEYVEKYRCGSPHMTTFMKISELVEQGTVIMSGNFFIVEFPNSSPIDKNNFSLYRYAKITNRPIVPYFFMETKELAYSFLTHIRNNMSLYVQHNKTGLDHNYNKKILAYQLNGFPVISQIEKLTGFEKVKDYFDKHYNHLVTTEDKIQRLSDTQFSNRTFDLLLRNKYEYKFRNDKYIRRGNIDAG